MSWVIHGSVIVNLNSQSHFTASSSKMFSATIGVVVGTTVGFSVWVVVTTVVVVVEL